MKQLTKMWNDVDAEKHFIMMPLWIIIYMGLFTSSGYSIPEEPGGLNLTCIVNVSQIVDGVLTWPETDVGAIAFSEEQCPSNTMRAGFPIAFRYCTLSTNTMPTLAEWESEVTMLGCDINEDGEDTDGFRYCPIDWDPYGNYCYYVNTVNKVSFSGAMAECQQLGGNLTSIRSGEEQLYHTQLARQAGEGLWIGLHDITNEGRFEWLDGSSFEFENWNTGEPNDWNNDNRQEDCVHLTHSGPWNDLSCSTNLGFVCKQFRAMKDGYCPPDTTFSANGILTWQEHAIGQTALSEETCGTNTVNSGRSIAVRYCTSSIDECADDTIDSDLTRVCEQDWAGFEENCYLLSDTKINFEQAEARCEELGATLTSIHNAGEQAFLEGLLTDNDADAYIGLHDKAIERTFRWVDHSDYNYNNWDVREPSNSGNIEDCAEVIVLGNRKGMWNDVPCRIAQSFICKKAGICSAKLGMERFLIHDEQLSASSMWDSNHGPSRARLNQPRDGQLRGSWTAASNSHNRHQWIQVDFRKQTTITAVITQGRADEGQWITRYMIEYTQDGSNWQYVTDVGSQDKVFNGNTDTTSPVTQQLQQPIKIIAVRIRPTEWHKYISLRFELIGCEDSYYDSCKLPSAFGWSINARGWSQGNTRSRNSIYPSQYWTAMVPDKEVPCDGWITEWQFYSWVARPFRAIIWRKVAGDPTRFKIVGINDIPASASIPHQSNTYTVQIQDRFKVRRGDMLGFAYSNPLLTVDNRRQPSDALLVRWFSNRNPNELQLGSRVTFTNSDNRAFSLRAVVDMVDEQDMPDHKHDKCVSKKGQWSMAKIISCDDVITEYSPSTTCSTPLGMEDGSIKNVQITASSLFSDKHAPQQARLNYIGPTNEYVCSWSALRNDRNQWIQVDLLHRKSVSGVILQGRDMTTTPCKIYGPQYVTKFKVQFGGNGFQWSDVKDGNNNAEVFDGNTDTTTPVPRYFHTPIVARFIRILPWEWVQHISMRFELLGCQDCLRDWDVNGDYCYYTNTDRMTFADAQSECKRLDSNLTSISNDDEQIYHALQAQNANEYLWIGLHDRMDEQRFTWVDGTVMDKDFDPPWGPYQPDNWGDGGEDCVHLLTGEKAGLWNDLPCTSSAGYMCKRPKVRRVGICPAILTALDPRIAGHKYLTWENALAGEVAFSDEVCPAYSYNAGLPIAIRICSPTSEWRNVEIMDCFNEIESTLSPVSNQLVPRCDPEYTESDYGTLHWSETDVGDATFSDEVCGNDTEDVEGPIAFRRCIHDYLATSNITKGYWQPVKMIGCNRHNDNSTTSTVLTEDDVDAVSRKMLHFTESMETIDVNDVHAVARMIKTIANMESSSYRVLVSMTEAINTVLEIGDPSLGGAQHDDTLANSTSDIVHALEKQVAKTMKYEDKVSIVESSLTVVGVRLSNDQTRPLRFSVYQSDRFAFTEASIDNIVIETNDFIEDKTPAASITIPSSVLEQQTKSTTSVSFIAYADDFLFRSRRLEADGLRVDAPIITTTINTSNPSDPIILTFKVHSNANSVDLNTVISKDSGRSSHHCVFWDYSLHGGIGDWSNNGCEVLGTDETGTVTCHCNHMSMFTILDINQITALEPLKRSSVMPVAVKSIVSCLSMIPVAITLIVLLGLTKLRGTKSYQTLCNFSVAILLLQIVFAAGIGATDNNKGCILVAALLQYLSLVSLLWLAIDIRFTYNDSQAPSSATSLHSQPVALIKAYAVSWGLPVVVVGLTMLISFDNFVNTQYCAIMVSPALFYGVAIPLSLIVLHNIFIFGCGFFAMKNRALNDDGQLKMNGSSNRLQATFVVSIAFPITLCVTHLFLEDPYVVVTRAVFGISQVSLGVLIVSMFCVYLDDVRVQMSRLFRKQDDPDHQLYHNSGFELEGEGDSVP